MYQIDFNRPQHIHFIGIGGISMSGLAEVLLGRGFKITGSDAHDSDLIEHLRANGAVVTIGQKAENITPDIDVIVYTAAVHPDNPEFAAAAKSGRPMLTRAELLGELMQNYHKSIAVAGTHGKTTTTSMIAHILLAADCDPTISVGGILPAIGGNIRVGASDTFVTEACEYTNSFLSLVPTVGMILNVDADHLDFFKDLDDIANSFHIFASQIPADGTLVMNRDSKKFDEVTSGISCKLVTYSLKEDADYTAANIEHDAFGCGSFDCYESGNLLGRITLSVPGIHNVSNALATVAAVRTLGIPADAIIEGLKNFTGADRRFEYKGKMGEVTVLDDYAHHPTEIKATLSAAKNVKHNKLWLIFQPHTYTRTKALFNEFVDAFTDADVAIVTDIYAAREKDVYNISSYKLVTAMKAKHPDKPVYYVKDFEDIVKYIEKFAGKDDIVMTMGAGDVYKVGDMLLHKEEKQ